MSDESSYMLLGLSLFVFLGFFTLLAYALTAFPMMKMFQKMNIEPWKAWVPVLGFWAFLEGGGLPGWIVLGIFLLWVPFFGSFLAIAVFVCIAIAAYRIGIGFQKNGAWVLLWIFLPIIWLFIMAFTKSSWRGSGVGNIPGSSAWGSGIGGQPYSTTGSPYPGYQPGGYPSGPGGYAQPGAQHPGAYQSAQPGGFVPPAAAYQWPTQTGGYGQAGAQQASQQNPYGLPNDSGQQPGNDHDPSVS